MRFMLDTNICVDIIRGRSPAVLQHLLRIPPSDVCISVITLSELEFGVAKSAAPERNHLALLEFLAPIAVQHSPTTRRLSMAAFAQIWRRRAMGSDPWTR
jgi:predicted nucleic acid-binding protein